MAPSSQQILDVCQALSEQEQLHATLGVAATGFVIAGTGAAIGTLLGGARGTLIGGLIGSSIAAIVGEGKCKSVVEIIRDDMTPEQQRKLADSVTRALNNFSPKDLAILLPMVLCSDPLKSIVLGEITQFMTNEMGMTIVDQYQ